MAPGPVSGVAGAKLYTLKVRGYFLHRTARLISPDGGLFISIGKGPMSKGNTPVRRLTLWDRLGDARDHRWLRNTFIIGFMALFTGISAWFHLIRGLTVAYSHFAYVPIFLASIWWGRRAVFVPLVLGGWMIFLELIDGLDQPLWPSLVRVGIFLAVGSLAGELNHRRRMARNELSEANAKLARLSRLHRDFLQITMHDLRSPVGAASALLTGLSTLAGDEMEPRQKHLLERAQARMEEVSSFLRDFQFLSAFDSSQLRHQAVRVDVRKLMKQVIEENRGLIAGKNHTASLEIPGTMPAIAAIPILVKEVIANYLTNAIKYTPNGGRLVLRGVDLGDRVRVEMEDNGIGIAGEDQKKLFQEFVRIRRETREGELKVPGIGLGLSISKRIVEMHGGRVSLDSEPGRGSVFSFEIPACPPGDGPVVLPEFPETDSPPGLSNP